MAKVDKNIIIEEAIQLIEELSNNGYSNYRIAKETNITDRTIGNYVNKSTKPTFANAKILLETYKPLGSELKGFSFQPMLNSGRPRNVYEVSPVAEEEYMMVEYADLRASAGMLGVGDVSQLPDTHKRLVPKEYAKGKFLVVRVDGNSMYDGLAHSLADGDEVLIYLNEDGINGDLPIKKTVFVITTRDGNVLKQINEINRNDGYLVCHSWNKDYVDFNIQLSDVFQIFTVCKIINKQISLV